MTADIDGRINATFMTCDLVSLLKVIQSDEDGEASWSSMTITPLVFVVILLHCFDITLVLVSTRNTNCDSFSYDSVGAICCYRASVWTRHFCQAHIHFDRLRRWHCSISAAGWNDSRQWRCVINHHYFCFNPLKPDTKQFKKIANTLRNMHIWDVPNSDFNYSADTNIWLFSVAEYEYK